MLLAALVEKGDEILFSRTNISSLHFLRQILEGTPVSYETIEEEGCNPTSMIWEAKSQTKPARWWLQPKQSNWIAIRQENGQADARHSWRTQTAGNLRRNLRPNNLFAGFASTAYLAKDIPVVD